MKRRIGSEVQRSTMMKLWKVEKYVVFKEIRLNTFVITFANDKVKIGLWKVDCGYLIRVYLH